MRRWLPVAAAVVCALAGLSAAGIYALEERDRAEVREYLARTTLDARRPEFVEAVAVQPSAAHAAFRAAGGGLADQREALNLSKLTAREQALWQAAFERQSETARETLALLAGVVAARPAEAGALGQLAELSLLLEKRDEAPREGVWREALRAATRLAPGDDGLAVARARALLSGWHDLEEKGRSEAVEAFRRAFLDKGFLESGFVPVAVVMGPRPAAALIPETSAAISTAFKAIGRVVDFETAVQLRARWKAAERKEREAALAELEATRARGNTELLVTQSRAFLSRYPPRAWDGEDGRKAGRRLLAVLPGEPAGSWRQEPRAEAVRWALEGRVGPESGADLVRLAALLGGVPEPVRARIALLAGDRVEWERAVRNADTSGTLEWTPFWVELALHELEAGRTSEAAAALRRVNRFALGECNVLLARRDVARATGDLAGEREAEEALGAVSPVTGGAFTWSAKGTLPLCVDPERHGRATVEVTLGPGPGRALVRSGWDGGVQEEREAASGDVLAIPLEGLRGRRVLGVRTFYGAPLVPVSTRIAGATALSAVPRSQP